RVSCASVPRTLDVHTHPKENLHMKSIAILSGAALLVLLGVGCMAGSTGQGASTSSSTTTSSSTSGSSNEAATTPPAGGSAAAPQATGSAATPQATGSAATPSSAPGPEVELTGGLKYTDLKVGDGEIAAPG